MTYTNTLLRYVCFRLRARIHWTGLVIEIDNWQRNKRQKPSQMNSIDANSMGPIYTENNRSAAFSTPFIYLRCIFDNWRVPPTEPNQHERKHTHTFHLAVHLIFHVMMLPNAMVSIWLWPLFCGDFWRFTPKSHSSFNYFTNSILVSNEMEVSNEPCHIICLFKWV